MSHVLSRDNGPFKRLLDDLASSKKLTLVIGAGAGLDAGLPLWPDLVRTFLEEGFKKAIDAGHIKPEPGESYESLAANVIDTQDILRAATFGRYLHGDQRAAAIKSALYHKETQRPRPGRIVKAVATLAHSFGPGLRIITTNYDDLIEHEFATNASVPYRAFTNSETSEMQWLKGDGSAAKEKDPAVDIYHLHGYAPFDGEPKGVLILDDEDYSITPVRPPGAVLPSLLSDGPTLFLGLSMTDPNLVAACYQAAKHKGGAGSLPWHGLFVGGSMTTPGSDLAWYIRQTLEGMGIHPLDLASYGQVSQVIYELVRRVSDGDAYWDDEGRCRYGHRFSQWSDRITKEYADSQKGDGYSKIQTAIHEELRTLLRDVQEHDLAPMSPDEHLALHLWVRRPGSDLGTLELWGSSAHLHPEGWSLSTQNMPVMGGTGVAAVDCVYQASIQIRNQASNSSDRWQAVVAVPIELTSHEYENVVVGIVTLSSTVPMRKSVLRARRDSALDKILKYGIKKLTPSVAA